MEGARRATLEELGPWLPFGLAIVFSAVGHLVVVVTYPLRDRVSLPHASVVELFVPPEPPRAAVVEERPAPEPEPEPVAPPRPRVRTAPRVVEQETPPVENTPPATEATPEATGPAVDAEASVPLVAPSGSGGALVSVATQPSGPPREASTGPSRAEREATMRTYLSEVRRRIAREKRYPRSARRLGIEGTVRVRLVIGADGSIASLRADGEASVLREAALDAVRAAGPFQAPPRALGPRVSVDVPLVYVLEEE